MKITILSAVFPPEPIVSAKTSYSLAKYLVNENHQVEVITNFPNRPEGRLYPNFKRSLIHRAADRDGFSITRCFTAISKESSMISRWAENISFGLTSSLALLIAPKPDVVYMNTWPIFASFLTSLVCKLKGIPYALSIQDIYPESLNIQGRLSPSGWKYQLLLSMDRWVCKHSGALIVLSDRFVDQFSKNRSLALQIIHVIPNWVEKDSVLVMEKSTFRAEQQIGKDEFVFLYAGNIGRAAGVDNLIRCFTALKPGKKLVLLIAGSGTQLPECLALAKETQGVRILFHTPWLPEETSRVLAAADVLLLPTHGSQSLVSVPSKLLSYLLASRPILASVQDGSDIAHVITQANCGWVVPPGDNDRLQSLVQEITQYPQNKLSQMGGLGRKFALEHFTSEKLLPKVAAILTDVKKSTQGE